MCCSSSRRGVGGPDRGPARGPQRHRPRHHGRAGRRRSTAAADADVLVIRGGGDRAFISGGDLKELAKIRTQSTRRWPWPCACAACATGSRPFPAPVIAALNGHALGGGAEVAVAADIRVAADDVTIGFNQSTAGHHAGLGRRRAAGRAGRPLAGAAADDDGRAHRRRRGAAHRAVRPRLPA